MVSEMTYTGTPDKVDNVVFVPGKSYVVNQLGYRNGSKCYGGTSGFIGSLFGIRKPLMNNYFIRVFSDNDSCLVAYSSEEVFKKYWK